MSHSKPSSWLASLAGSLAIGVLTPFIHSPTSALADAHVGGQPDAVRVEAHQSSVEEVLNALGAVFKVRYRTSTALTELISGTYEGSLRQVVASVLDRYDHVVKNSDEGIEIIVYKLNKGTAPVSVPASSRAIAQSAKGPPPSPARPGPVVAPWPPPPPPNQDPVVSMLDTAARSQIPPAGGPGNNIASGSNTGPAQGAPSTQAPLPGPADVAQMTRSASSQLDSLRAALSRLPH
jgi:hypothetical protein